MSKRVLIMNTGGTLASVAREHGLTPGLTTESMERELHIVAGEAQLTMQEFSSLDSANIFPEDWARLAQAISLQREYFDGVVVIHGTDTLAYTSSMLSYMLQNINIPVVITGSQLSISNPVADAMENLRCAIYMAQSGCPGVFVAFNRKVMLGCRASKVRSLSFDAFDSINCENVAEISSIGMKINRRMLPVKKGVFKLQDRYCPDVAVIKLFPGTRRKGTRLSTSRRSAWAVCRFSSTISSARSAVSSRTGRLSWSERSAGLRAAVWRSTRPGAVPWRRARSRLTT